MSNSTTGRIWKADTAGMLKSGPVVVKKVVFVPNNAGDQVLLTYFERGNLVSGGSDSTFDETTTAKIETSNTITISGGSILDSSVADGTVWEITRSSGLAANVNVPVLVKTAGTDTVLVVWDTLLSNEATVEYEWKTYTSYDFLKAFGGSKDTIPFDFGNGFSLPNLSVETISGGAYVYIYI